jgi:hypothetical protein
MALSSLIPGTNRFADLPADAMQKTSFFHKNQNDFSVRASYHETKKFNPIYGKFENIPGELKGYEVVYPNGKICSHVFATEQLAKEFIKEVKNKMS